MTTITIKDSSELYKTEFDTTRELYIYLRKKLSPVSIFLVDDNNVPEFVLKSVKNAAEEGEDDLINFKG
jgi:hypothetical protein